MVNNNSYSNTPKSGSNPYSNYSKGGNNVVEGVTNNKGEDLLFPLSASCYPVAASSVAYDGFEFETENIIPSSNLSSSFDPTQNIVEFFVYDTQRNILDRNYNFKNWGIEGNTDFSPLSGSYIDPKTNEKVTVPPATASLTNVISVDPPTDVFDAGFTTGEVYALYNFINYELGSSVEDLFFIDEISSDRTELKLKSNFISNTAITNGYSKLKSKQIKANYFDEFYINLLNNKYEIAINCLLDYEETGEAYILIKLYVPLPTKYKVGTELYVATKVGETQAYKVEFLEDIETFVDGANYIKGPNVNIGLQDLVNNSTQLKSYDELTNTKSSSSLDSVLRVLDQVGVTITPDYSYNTFDQFINFSSAKERINNFYEKVSSIQSYEADIETLLSITGSNPNVPEISQSLASLQTNIKNIITNFDGYESYLYYNSSSFAYPKTGSAYPYTLKPTGSTEVLNWMGSDVESSQYYGGYVLSASLYDENNQNWLYYTIPQFITENADNDNYVSFANMVGQSFDEIWLYTKTLSERYNTINDPDKGLPLGLAAEAIKGLGFETFGNNYNNQDNFIGLTGEDNGVYVPPTGSELITQYIAVNNGEIINYWDLGYSWLNYVEQLNEPGFPYAIDKVSKEIYKRLYHNMAYLTKKKGTISGLRQLINVWGIPNTILRINEFGGKNRDNTDDYDLWYKRYSYAYTPVANSYIASSSVKVPWMPLERNYIADSSKYIVPDGIGVRFKTTGFPSSSYAGEFYSQSIMVKKSNGTNDTQFDWGVGLFYENQPSGSYSGSSNSDYYEYGKLRFYISGSVADGGTVVSDDIYLPFFNKGWWTILLQRNQHYSASEATSYNEPVCYTLYAANKQYDGWDGNVLGWEGSASICINLTASAGAGGYGIGNYGTNQYGGGATYDSASLVESWNSFGVSQWDGVYVGGFISGSDVGTYELNDVSKIFSGSFQEFRYYSNDIAQTVFNDFVMNPESIEGNNITGSESSFDIVNFRAPLGNELENKFIASSSYGDFVRNITSSHPAITGSANLVITQSFINPSDSSLTSSYEFIHYSNSVSRTYSKPNVETYFLDQPAIGVRNRVTNKIQIDDNEDYGTVLSRYRSIDQNYLISASYTEDINNLEVAFSPQDEVNDDIIQSFGYGVISDAIADPRFVSSSDDYYPQLRKIAIDYFKKYTEGDVWDYLRLIKYFDNSLFKAIKSYVPARTSVSTGVVIKQHMLERNRRQPVQITNNTTVAYAPTNEDIVFQNLEITSSIQVGSFTGSNAGVPPNLRGHVSASGAGFNIVPITQSWSASNATISGSVDYIDETQTEFFNGEYSGSDFVVTTQSLLVNPYAESTALDTGYLIQHTASTALGEQFPSYSYHVVLQFFDNTQFESAYQWGKVGFIDTPKFGLNHNMANTCSIALFQSADQQNYYIASIAFGSSAEPKDQGFLSFINNLLDPQPITKTLLPWNQQSGLSPTNPYPSFQIMDVGPYFRIEGFTPNTALYGGIDFENSGLLDNLNSGIVVSPFLGNSEIVTTGWGTTSTISRTADGTRAEDYRYYQFNDPSINGARPIRMNQAHAVQSGTNVNVIQDDNDQVVVFFSKFGGLYQDALNQAKAGQNLSTGRGSVNWIGTTWTGSGPDNGTWLPAVATFNKFSRDRYTGALIDNTSTLENNPSYNFTVRNYSGTPTTADNYGLAGNVLSSSLTPSNGVISNPSLTELGFAYDMENARGISGSGGLGSGIAGQFRPKSDTSEFYIPFNPAIPDQTDFYDSAFNPLINNATESVKNTYLQVVEYNDGADIPSNLIPIISQSALKARIPDSFYTQKSSINPRYDGCELVSADYNVFTPPSQSIQYLNAISGSAISESNQTNPRSPYWIGDKSYGKTSAIDKNPIYFAHFKTSYNNLQLAGTFTFEVDSLIEAPRDNIQGDKTPQTPTVIKLDGSNENLTNVRSTFELNRKVTIAYSSAKFRGVDYSNLAVGNNIIFQGGLEMQTIGVSTTGLYGSGSAAFPNYAVTWSYKTPDWLVAARANGNSPLATYPRNEVSTFFTQSYNNQDRTGKGLMATGSGFLVLQGEQLRISQSLYYEEQKGAVQWAGPGLAVVNSINYAVSNSTPNYFNTPTNEYYIGVPIANSVDTLINTDPLLPKNYFYQEVTSSANGDLRGFRNELELPVFQIKVGDEIEVTENSSLVSGSIGIGQSLTTVTFIVTDVGALDFDETPSLADQYETKFSASACDGTNCYLGNSMNSLGIKNKISVYPNPANFGFVDGQITGFIVRRRINADDRVIIYQNPPQDDLNSVTGSGDGYLIPVDFTPQQKRNVLTLINQLKNKNAFDSDLPELRE